jgi:bacteriorhodopsin
MILQSAQVSVGLQLLTTMIDIWGLQLGVDPKHMILQQLLRLEIVVQVVELLFYVWLIKRFNHIQDITPFRYLDWIITTPTMLLQLMAFMSYDKYPSLQHFIRDHKTDISRVIALNWTMMILGLFGEMKCIDRSFANVTGFVPFISYFYMIYDKFVPKHRSTTVDKVKQGLFWYYAFFWSLYGVASFMPYVQKNTFYNILDVFAKNFYGLFLVVYLLYLQKQSV